MSNKMPEWLRVLYLCYLGKTMERRMSYISMFVNEHNGREFFGQYSTPTDSIADFIRRAKAKGLKL